LNDSKDVELLHTSASMLIHISVCVRTIARSILMCAVLLFNVNQSIRASTRLIEQVH